MENKMGVWYHRFSGHEYEQFLGDREGQESLVQYSPWGHKESDRTQQLNNTTVHFGRYSKALPMSKLFGLPQTHLTLGRPRRMGCGGRWEGGSGWGTHVNPWLIHVNVWQKPLQYCKVSSLQLIKINEKIKEFILRKQQVIYASKSMIKEPFHNCNHLTIISNYNFQIDQKMD